MRVMNRVNPQDESGAVLVIVALALTAIFGMTVLVVDVGGLLGLRRRMVTAADSAALSAAQSCATEQTGVSFQADVIARANVPETTRAGLDAEGCGTSSEGFVRVSYTTPKDLYFAPILGTPDRTSVVGKAMAKWGPSGGATPAPIILNFAASNNSQCLLMGDGQVCAFWHDGSIRDITATDQFAFANLGRWGVSALASCRNADRQLPGWITGAVKVDAELVSGGRTYTCVTSGRSRLSTTLAALRSRIGDTLHLPVGDATGVVPLPRREKVSVVGFVPLEVVDVISGNDPRATGTPGVSGNCRVTLFPRQGTRIWLDALTRPGCPAGRRPQTISNLVLSPRRGGPFVEGRDYSYDDVTHVVTWTRGGRRVIVELRFDWSIPGTAGACGNRTPNSSSICLVTRFTRPHIGGKLGVAARDFGLRAIGLQE